MKRQHLRFDLCSHCQLRIEVRRVGCACRRGRRQAQCLVVARNSVNRTPLQFCGDRCGLRTDKKIQVDWRTGKRAYCFNLTLHRLGLGIGETKGAKCPGIGGRSDQRGCVGSARHWRLYDRQTRAQHIAQWCM